MAPRSCESGAGSSVDPTPRTVVAICTANRPDPLRCLLAHLATASLDSPAAGPCILVVIDNRPGSVTARIVAEASASLPVPVRYIEEPRPGISSARNRAVREALTVGAECLAFIDDDDLPDPDWLVRLHERLAETEADVALGTWRLPDDFRVPPLLEKIDYFKPFRPEHSRLFDLPLWGGTFNMLIRRRAIEHLAPDGELFRPEFSATGGEDTDFLIRADRCGCRITVAERSVVVRGWEPDRLTLRGAMRRGFRQGCSQMHLAARHLPDAAFAKLQRKATRRLLRTVLRALPALRRPKRLAVILVQIAYRLGELHGARGRTFSYYG